MILFLYYQYTHTLHLSPTTSGKTDFPTNVNIKYYILYVCVCTFRRVNEKILYYNVGTSVVSRVHNNDITHITSVNRLEFGIYYCTLGTLYYII